MARRDNEQIANRVGIRSRATSLRHRLVERHSGSGIGRRRAAVRLRGWWAGWRALDVSGCVLGLLSILFVRNVFGVASGIGLTVGLALAGRYLPPAGTLFLVSFLAVQCCLNALLDLLGLVFSTGLLPSGHNDAVLMSRLLPLPPILWALVWSIASGLLVWGAVRGLWRRGD